MQTRSEYITILPKLQIRLRPAIIADAEQISSVYLSSRKQFLPFAPIPHSDSKVLHWLTTQLIPSEGVTVIENESKIIGFIGTSHKDNISWIDQFYIAPEYVGLGIGTKIIQTLKKRLTHPIRLYTFQQNTVAQRFYERLGFKLLSTSDGSDNEEKCPDALYEYHSNI